MNEDQLKVAQTLPSKNHGKDDEDKKSKKTKKSKDEPKPSHEPDEYEKNLAYFKKHKKTADMPARWTSSGGIQLKHQRIAREVARMAKHASNDEEFNEVEHFIEDNVKGEGQQKAMKKFANSMREYGGQKRTRIMEENRITHFNEIPAEQKDVKKFLRKCVEAGMIPADSLYKTSQEEQILLYKTIKSAIVPEEETRERAKTFINKAPGIEAEHREALAKTFANAYQFAQDEPEKTKILLLEDSSVQDEDKGEPEVIKELKDGEIVKTPIPDGKEDDPSGPLKLSTISPTSISPGTMKSPEAPKTPAERPKGIKRIEEKASSPGYKGVSIPLDEFKDSGVVDYFVGKLGKPLSEADIDEKKRLIQKFFMHIPNIQTEEVFNKFRDIWEANYAERFNIRLGPWTPKIKIKGGKKNYLKGVNFIDDSPKPQGEIPIARRPRPKVFKDPKGSKTSKKAPGTVFKAPKTANAKTFFDYDIHDIFRIIEGELGVELTEPLRLELEALIHVAVNEQINRHGLSVRHGESSIEKIIEDIEDYINIRNKSSERFAFTGQRRQQLISILKRAAKLNDKHGQKSSRMMDRISALRNFL